MYHYSAFCYSPGSGTSKKLAKRNAAAKMLSRIHDVPVDLRTSNDADAEDDTFNGVRNTQILSLKLHMKNLHGELYIAHCIISTHYNLWCACLMLWKYWCFIMSSCCAEDLASFELFSYSWLMLGYNRQLFRHLINEVHLLCIHSTLAAELSQAKVKVSAAHGTPCVTLLERRSSSCAATLWACPLTPTSAPCWVTCPWSSVLMSVTWT